MIYDNDVITGMYRTAKNKKQQLEILAELNMCSRNQIFELLKSYRMVKEEDRDKLIKNNKKRFWDEEKDTVLIKLKREGFTYAQMAKRLNVSYGAINHRIKYLRNAGEIL